MNPIPNKAPYVVEVGGKEYFNAFAIRDIRFAMNDLINRQYLVDGFSGAGTPAFTMASTGQPGTYRYNLLATLKFGLTAEGNGSKGFGSHRELNASCSRTTGKCWQAGEEGRRFWYFDNEPVTIKIAIRVDDPRVV